MSRDGSVTFTWGDGEHRFRLPIGQLRELQERCDCGPAFLLDRIRSGRWLVDDLRETLRLGLIGGGMAPVDALKLVQRYVDQRPLLESVQPAIAVLAAPLLWPEDEKLGKPGAATDQPNGSSAESSPSPPSMEPAPASDSDQAKSTP